MAEQNDQPPKPRELGDEADPRHFNGTLPDGTPFDLMLGIVPIVRQSSAGFALVGTGFFIEHAGMLISAKHVFEDFALGGGSTFAGCVQFLPNNTSIMRQFAIAASHTNADIGVALPYPAINPATGFPVIAPVCTMTATIPPIGSHIHTYAYPKTAVEETAGKLRVNFSAAYYEGRIEEYLPAGRDRVMLPGPCWRTSMTIHGGASGGPVFDERGRVFAINSTGFGYVSSIVPVFQVAFKAKLKPDEDLVLTSVGQLIQRGIIFLDN
jgi:trypsin-like peptidase